jgi:hypothetical protein
VSQTSEVSKTTTQVLEFTLCTGDDHAGRFSNFTFFFEYPSSLSSIITSSAFTGFVFSVNEFISHAIFLWIAFWSVA